MFVESLQCLQQADCTFTGDGVVEAGGVKSGGVMPGTFTGGILNVYCAGTVELSGVVCADVCACVLRREKYHATKIVPAKPIADHSAIFVFWFTHHLCKCDDCSGCHSAPKPVIGTMVLGRYILSVDDFLRR